MGKAGEERIYAFRMRMGLWLNKERVSIVLLFSKYWGDQKGQDRDPLSAEFAGSV